MNHQVEADASALSAANVLTFASAVELATGLALLAAPQFVGRLLLGVDLAASGTVVARCFGAGLVALGVACWPVHGAGISTRARSGMLIYNALLAAYLAWVGLGRDMGGALLWPAVLLHAGVALLLAWRWRNDSVRR